MRLETPIRDVAAFTLCPHSRAKGMKLLDATIKQAATLPQRLNALFVITAIGCGVVVILSVLALALVELKVTSPGAPSRYALASAHISIIALLAIWMLLTRIQYNSKFRFARPPDNLIAAPLQRLIGEFAAQTRDARTSAGTVRAKFFESDWAILLFSDEPGQRGWVRSPGGRRETREIFTSVILPSPSEAADTRLDDTHEPALMNTIPEDQWLVGGSTVEFNAGLDRFLHAEIPPSHMDWFRLALTVGRRELRRGGQHGTQAAAIKHIKSELERLHGNSRGPHGGESAHLIKHLLQGRRGKKDIRGYFDHRDV